MADKKKLPLKQRDPYKYYRNVYAGLQVGRWISILTPFIAIFAANFEEYFLVDMGNGSQINMSIGAILACAIGGIAIYSGTKKNPDGSSKSNPFSSTIAFAVTFAFAFLFQRILEDLTLILGCATIGQLVGCGFNISSLNAYEKKNAYLKANINAETMSRSLASRKGNGFIPYE